MSGQLGPGGHFGTSAEKSWIRSVLGPKWAILQKWVPYSQRYLVLGLVGLVRLVGFSRVRVILTVTVRVSRVSVMVSVRDSAK